MLLRISNLKIHTLELSKISGMSPLIYSLFC